MRITTFIMLTLVLAACSTNNKGGLDGNVQTLELFYTAWACDCASWTTLSEFQSESMDDLHSRNIYIEPANSSLELPDTLGYNYDVIKVTGQFYNEKGFPDNYQSFEKPEKAMVFRYTKYEVIKSHYRESRNISDK